MMSLCFPSLTFGIPLCINLSPAKSSRVARAPWQASREEWPAMMMSEPTSKTATDYTHGEIQKPDCQISLHTSSISRKCFRFNRKLSAWSWPSVPVIVDDAVTSLEHTIESSTKHQRRVSKPSEPLASVRSRPELRETELMRVIDARQGSKPELRKSQAERAAVARRASGFGACTCRKHEESSGHHLWAQVLEGEKDAEGIGL